MYKTVTQTSEIQTKLAKLQVPEIFFSLRGLDNFFPKSIHIYNK
jgi:hypothetical protein